MKAAVTAIIVMAGYLFSAPGAFAAPVKSFISDGQLKIQAGDIPGAIEIMKRALAEHSGNATVIDFILGFGDELAPQTAVWIEDAQGTYVKTVYVSGFSGYVKEVQVTLPKWAKSSEFQGVDAVTSVSIDCGGHQYVWDMTDWSGKPVKPGSYTVCIEISFRPSM